MTCNLVRTAKGQKWTMAINDFIQVLNNQPTLFKNRDVTTQVKMQNSFSVWQPREDTLNWEWWLWIGGWAHGIISGASILSSHLAQMKLNQMTLFQKNERHSPREDFCLSSIRCFCLFSSLRKMHLLRSFDVVLPLIPFHLASTDNMMAMHTQHRCIVHVRGIDLDAGHDPFQHTSQQVIHFQNCNSMSWHSNSNFEWLSTLTFKFKWQTFCQVDASQITQSTHTVHFISSLTANPHILLSIPAALADIVLHKCCYCFVSMIGGLASHWNVAPGIIVSFLCHPQPVACSIRLDALLWQPWSRRRRYLSFTWRAC